MRSSNKPYSNRDPWIFSDKGIFWILLLSSAVVFVINILLSVAQNGLGFPLDDAWIHQTYARSIATSGSWKYSVNDSSAGSTSPLWTLLLVPGFLFGSSSPYFWTFLISWFSYFGIVFVTTKLCDSLLPGNKGAKLILGLIMVFEWHLVWASGSGMETVLFCLGVMLIFYLLLAGKKYFLVVFLVGLLVCVRPDGITLLGPVLLVLGGNILKGNASSKALLWMILGLVVPLIGYGCHNYSLSGQILPNTFFAKSAEYRELLSTSIIGRIFNLSTVLISGAGILLLPGFLRSVYTAFKSKDPWKMSTILWILGFLVMYAIRLPVVYQHGRYLMPVIPVFLFLGFLGTVEILALIRPQKQFAYTTIIFAGLLITSLIFLVEGFRSYSTDVKVINRLMVEPAIWLHDNSEEDSIIAAHDIGAIGFFSERKIIDLAGLIDPMIVPIIRDEDQLTRYILESGADYLVVFADWYEDLGKMGSLEKEYSLKLENLAKTVEIRSLP